MLGLILGALYSVSNVMLTVKLQGKYYYPSFTDKEIATKKTSVAWAVSNNKRSLFESSLPIFTSMFFPLNYGIYGLFFLSSSLNTNCSTYFHRQE